MLRTLLAVTFSLLACAPLAHGLDDSKIVDLTYPFGPETLHWPTAEPFHFDKVSEGKTPGGFWYSSYNYGGSEHVGTHMDAPFHFAEGKWTADRVPLSRLIGPGIVIDVRRQADKNADYSLPVSDIREWEKTNGPIPRGSIILIRSGWGKYWGDRKRYFGTDEPGNVTDLHFPGLSREAAEFLIKQRGITAVGIDTPSIDHGPSRDFVAHQVLGAANVVIFENVAALERMPTRGSTVYAIPMKIRGGSGAPLRIFALLQ